MSNENLSASRSGHVDKNQINIISKVRPSNFKCLENKCGRSFKTNNKLIGHLSEEHGMKFEYLEYSFASYDEFQQWKAKIQEENVVNYVCQSKSAGKTSYYYCNRSFKGKNGRQKGTVYKRLLKSQGSCKMESCCTSHLTVSKENGKLCVIWQKTHYGHGRDLQHVRFTDNVKLSVASKLISGARSSKILDSVRRSKIISKDMETFERHKKAVLAFYNSVQYSDEMYTLTKETGESYVINKISSVKCCNVTCRDCEICVHMLSCSCPDYNINSSICEHIHYLVINNNDLFDEGYVVPDVTSNDYSDDGLVSNANPQKDQASIIINAIDDIRNMDLSKLDNSVVEHICYHLSIIRNLANMPSLDCNAPVSTSKQSGSVNKKVVDPQFRFQLIKKPTKNRKTILNRPIKKELSNVNFFLTTDLDVSTCPSNDHKYC